MIESRFYTCKFCFKEYVPTRRGAQKFCSNTCRSKAHFHKKRNLGLTKEKPKTFPLPDKKITVPKIPSEKTSIDKMSVPGVANAAVGNFVADGLKSIFQKEENKSATKGDLNRLMSLISGARYFPVNNMNNDSYGRKAYYDVETGNIIYY